MGLRVPDKFETIRDGPDARKHRVHPDLSTTTACNARIPTLRLTLTLLSFSSFVFVTLSKDVTKRLQQLRVLIIQATRYRKVRPLHPLAQREQPDSSYRITNGLAPYVVLYLLLEKSSPRSRSSATFRIS